MKKYYNRQIHFSKGRYSYSHLSGHVKTHRLRKKYGRPYRHSTGILSDCQVLMDAYLEGSMIHCIHLLL